LGPEVALRGGGAAFGRTLLGSGIVRLVAFGRALVGLGIVVVVAFRRTLVLAVAAAVLVGSILSLRSGGAPQALASGTIPSLHSWGAPQALAPGTIPSLHSWGAPQALVPGRTIGVGIIVVAVVPIFVVAAIPHVIGPPVVGQVALRSGGAGRILVFGIDIDVVVEIVPVVASRGGAL